MRLIAPADLRRFVADCFVGMGVTRPDAETTADVLVYADLRGLDAHGVYRLPAYLDRLARGLVRPADVVPVAGRGAVRRLDAGFALGPVAATRATDLAVELAGEHGVGVVGVGRSSHLGAAGFYARRAARREVVALVMSNGPRVVAPFGAAEPFLGTNPLAVGIPLGRHGVFVHDMATGSSRAKIRRAADRGEPIEPGIAVDADGRPTTDAAAALLGCVLPVGGAKGSGLGVAITLLTGMLGGGAFDDELPPTYGSPPRRQDIGHVVVAIDPWCLADRADTLARVEALVERIHGLRPAGGVDRVRLSGENADAIARDRTADGIPVRADELARWADSCVEHGLTEQADWARAAQSCSSTTPSSTLTE